MTRYCLPAGVLIVLLFIGCGDRERNAASGTDGADNSAVVPAGAPESAPVEAPANDSVASAIDSDVTGAYFALDALPEELAELDHLLLATIDENAAPAPLNGFLRAKAANAPDYMLIAPVLDGTHLTFTTTTVAGVHYAFDGSFEVLARFAENPPDPETAVLVGTLRKLRNDQEVASAPVRFGYQAGG